MKDTLNTERLLTTEQAADLINIKPKTLINMRTNKEGPHFVKIGRLVRYRYRDLMKYLDQNTTNPAA